MGQFVSQQDDLTLVCRHNNAGLLVVDVRAGEAQSNNKIIHYLGDDEFFPAGVPSVRLGFRVEQEKASSVTIRGSVPAVTLHAGA
jgi:hypothetical protein